MKGRIYQAWLTVSVDIPDPAARLYQAWLNVTEPDAALRARLYQAWMSTEAAGTGKARLYQAWLTTSLPVDFVPSGLQTRRGGNLGPLTTRTYRGGEL